MEQGENASGTSRAAQRMAWAAALLLAWGLSGCQSVDLSTVMLPSASELSAPRRADDEQIAIVMDDVYRGMQARRIYQVLAHVSRTYRDAEGRDYAQMQGYLNEVFARYRTIRITRVPPKIVISGDQAKVVESFTTVAEPADAKADAIVNLQGQVTAYLEREGGRWVIVEWSNLP